MAWILYDTATLANLIAWDSAEQPDYEPAQGQAWLEVSPPSGNLELYLDDQGQIATRERAPAPQTVMVPPVVTKVQARLALQYAGLLSSVEAAIASLPSPEREIVLIKWQDSPEFYRDDPTLLMVGEVRKLTPEQIDQLFILAATL